MQLRKNRAWTDMRLSVRLLLVLSFSGAAHGLEMTPLRAELLASTPTPDSAAAHRLGSDASNFFSTMSSRGCKLFANTLLANHDAVSMFKDVVDGGLTIFCPVDNVFKGFLPRYRKLTAAMKTSLLQYHGVPVYLPMELMKSNDGVMDTLATNGAKKFDFKVLNDGQFVTLQTKVVTANITGTLLDVDPVAIYTINKVLLPNLMSIPNEFIPPPSDSDTEGGDADSEAPTGSPGAGPDFKTASYHWTSESPDPDKDKDLDFDSPAEVPAGTPAVTPVHHRLLSDDNDVDGDGDIDFDTPASSPGILPHYRTVYKKVSSGVLARAKPPPVFPAAKAVGQTADTKGAIGSGGN